MRRDPDQSLRRLWLAVAGLLLLHLPLIPRRTFDPDELEHAHAAWCLFRGMLPYKDFFEHHTPWYYYTLRPLFHGFAVDASFEGARGFLLVARALSFVLTVASVLLVGRLGRRFRDRRVGAVAALLLASQPLFFKKTLEIRPDLLALPLFLAALCRLLDGLAGGDDAPAPLRAFAVAGLSLGAAVMCTQKMLFVLPGLLVGLGPWVASPGRARPRLGAVAAFLVGVTAPGLATWGAFALQHAGPEFIANNFLLNARWKHVVTRQWIRLLKTSAPVLGLAALALIADGRRLSRPARDGAARDHGAIVLACTMLGLFAGVRVIPTAQAQYYLMPLPLVCLFAAEGLFLLAGRAPRPALLLGVAAAGLAILPVLGVKDAFTARNDAQLARLRQVFETTRPTDLVMDGWEGVGVFRPHAFYYYFIHEELLPMLDPRRVDAFLDDLESGRVRPKLIALDPNLTALGPRFLAFVARGYTSDDGFLYYARGS